LESNDYGLVEEEERETVSLMHPRQKQHGTASTWLSRLSRSPLKIVAFITVVHILVIRSLSGRFVPMQATLQAVPISRCDDDNVPSSNNTKDDSVSWNDYRIGDGVIFGTLKKKKVCEQWPDSLLCEYLKRTSQKKNSTILADIVSQWNTSRGRHTNKPCTSTTVLHLRLGDGLCGRYDLGSWSGTRCKGAKVGTTNARIPSCWEKDTDCFVNQHKDFYAYPKNYYEPVATDLLESVGNVTRIVVVADPSHWTRNKDMRNGNFSIDYAYRDNVISFFRSKGFHNIKVRKDSSRPDEDFVFMSSAQNFVQGGGGYSELISSVVSANGGRVFKPRTAQNKNRLK